MFTDRDIKRVTQQIDSDLNIYVHPRYRVASAGLWEIHPSQYQPVSFDLRLGDLTDQDGFGVTNDRWDGGEPFEILPGDFLLGNTIEAVKLGRRIWGKVEGKSTRARQGLLVEAAGLVDPCFHGTLTLELANLGRKPVELFRGQRIAQVMFGWTNSDPIRAYGDPGLGSHYQGQVGPTPARL